MRVKMVIIDNNSDVFTVKLPNNLTKGSSVPKILVLKNMETKVSYTIEFEDTEVSPYFYVFDRSFEDLPVGEYEYEIEGNLGLLRVGQDMKKTVYDPGMTFKSYEG